MSDQNERSKIFVDRKGSSLRVLEVKRASRRRPLPIPSASPGSQTLKFGQPPRLQLVPAEKSSRCSVKGCVFPARFDHSGSCSYHYLQRQEPNLFESRQPTVLLLDQAKFALPREQADDSRTIDRRRQAIEWQTYLLEEAA
jgi:hypothetical protein